MTTATHAAKEVAHLQETVANVDDAVPSARDEASALCARLAAMLNAAADDGRTPSIGELRAVETRVRDLARDAGGGTIR